LKSLDSDERIQGNPRKFNPHKKGFHAEMATVQENPNLADQNGEPIAEKEPNRLLPRAKRS
jgi:hypothetical protein